MFRQRRVEVVAQRHRLSSLVGGPRFAGAGGPAHEPGLGAGPPDPGLRAWRDRVWPGEWRRGDHVQVNRSLLPEFAAKLASWQSALEQARRDLLSGKGNGARASEQFALAQWTAAQQRASLA